MIALDGVYTVSKSGKPKFHRVNAPNQTELRTLLNSVIQRVVRRLEREGVRIRDPEQPWLNLDFHEPMDSLSAASTEASDRRYRIAISPHSGRRTLTLHDPSFIRTDKPEKTLTADRDGFSLNATVSCQPYQRDRLERLCRYVTRPAICLERLTVRADGKIQYELKNLFRRGRHRTAPHISCFRPWIFLANLQRWYPDRATISFGITVYSLGAAISQMQRMRNLIVPARCKKKIRTDRREHKSVAESEAADELIAPLTWAQRLKRVFERAAFGLI